MADEYNNFSGINAPQLEETTYVPKAKNPANSLDDIAVPVLEETTYVPKAKNAGLDGISAPNLSDTYTAPTSYQNSAPQYQQYGGAQNPAQSAPQFQQYGGAQNTAQSAPQFQQYGGTQNTAQSAPQFQQYGGAQNTAQSAPQFQQYGGAQNTAQSAPQFQQYGGAQNTAQSTPQFQQYGSAQNTAQSAPQFQQYGSVQNTAQSAPQYQPGNAGASAMDYNPAAKNPNHTLDDIQKPLLEDEPPAQERYVPKYQDPDLEAAKKQSVDRAIKSSLASKPASFDEEKSRETYREFMRERDSEMAQKGAFQVVILGILGILSGILAVIFSFMPLKENTPGFLDMCNMLYIALGAAIAGGSIAMFVKSTSTQKAASSIFVISTILHVIPGMFVMFSKEKGAFPIILYVLVLVINIIISFIFGSNENIKKHYNGH